MTLAELKILIGPYGVYPTFGLPIYTFNICELRCNKNNQVRSTQRAKYSMCATEKIN